MPKLVNMAHDKKVGLGALVLLVALAATLFSSLDSTASSPNLGAPLLLPAGGKEIRGEAGEDESASPQTIGPRPQRVQPDRGNAAQLSPALQRNGTASDGLSGDDTDRDDNGARDDRTQGQDGHRQQIGPPLAGNGGAGDDDDETGGQNDDDGRGGEDDGGEGDSDD